MASGSLVGYQMRPLDSIFKEISGRRGRPVDRYSAEQFPTREELLAESDGVLSVRELADPDRTISLGDGGNAFTPWGDGNTFTSWRNSKECQDEYEGS